MSNKKSGRKPQQKRPAPDESSDSDFPDINAVVADQHSNTNVYKIKPKRPTNKQPNPWDSSDREIENCDEEADKVQNETRCDSAVLLHEPKAEDFIIAELGTTKGAKKKFVARIVSIEEDGRKYWCSFLRARQKIKDAFVFHNAEDLLLVQHGEVKKILASVLKLRRGGFQFPGHKF
ncbi:unnamed protein product [Brassicogethes aeneus]|uniref:Uncharacterized protein n=1 Tax=Brassicogethes aeneus TaxID=1431903 RepID=A0A9P0FD18_BRAAE|nr:unnamed protein product [Brassicogethes aeneus]